MAANPSFARTAAGRPIPAFAATAVPYADEARAGWARRSQALARFQLTSRRWEGVATAAAFAVPFVLPLAAVLWLHSAANGFRIVDPLADYVAGLGWGLAGLIGIAIAPMPSLHKRPLMLLWMVHLGVALALMLGYESYYGLDAAGYFNNGIIETDPIGSLSFGQGTGNITALVGIASWVAGDSYNALKVVWGFIGLSAIYVFYLAARLYLGRDDLRLLYLLGLFPSIAFWTSILGKDPITLLGLGLFTLGAVGTLRRGGIKYLLIIGAGLALAAFIRVWLGAIFLAPFAAVSILAAKGGPLRKIVMLLVLLPAFAFALQSFSGKFSIASADDLVATTSVLSQNWAHGGSGETIQGGFQSIQDMVAFMPLGVATALFRPLPGELLSPFGLLASLENGVVIFLLFGALRRHPLRRLRDPVLLWVALTIFTWAAVYGFISYQNLGSAFRFKLQVMPLLLLLLLALRTPLPAAQAMLQRSLPRAAPPPLPLRGRLRAMDAVRAGAAE